MESGVWIIVLEAVLAIGILLGIVWWTLPRRDRHSDKKDEDARS